MGVGDQPNRSAYIYTTVQRDFLREKGAGSEFGPNFPCKTGWGHPLCGTDVSLYNIHFHRYCTGVRFRLVEVPEVSAAHKAPVGLPILCHK